MDGKVPLFIFHQLVDDPNSDVLCDMFVELCGIDAVC